MRNSSNAGNSLHKLFVSQLADMHSAETQLSKALIVLAKAARSEDLKELLEAHQKETEGHAESIELIAESLDVKLPKKTCRAMKGLIKEAVVGLVKNIASSVRDTEIIAAGNKIEHYEIASYGTLCRWAKEMGYTHELPQLVSILKQEQLADTLLTELSHGAGPLKQVVRRVSQKRIKDAVGA